MKVNSMFMGEYDSDFMVSGDEHTYEDIQQDKKKRSNKQSSMIKKEIKKLFRPDSGTLSNKHAF